MQGLEEAGVLPDGLLWRNDEYSNEQTVNDVQDDKGIGVFNQVVDN